MGDQSLQPWTPAEEDALLGPLPEKPKALPEAAEEKPPAKRSRSMKAARDGAGEANPPKPEKAEPVDSDPTDQAPPFKDIKSTFGDFMRRTLDP